ncbi:class I SAM-dependent DNA methyltransferase [Streptomyces triticirhizae]|uniref:Class I SAM-dependent methyltransferase n=1 Tax=Streptomyces triticirhizae TaxID=2483353 RepID=A0A3M2MC79_9ACTN|nr:class I SAM-dependent methyltransferase [Streptomyces triticirhizae]RMI46245.1 class I SAM-dependent methyltransferase [Streptomyces triticirhizae]
MSRRASSPPPPAGSRPPHTARTRTAYDTVAEDYARLLGRDLDRRPLERALLGAFAELVQSGGSGLPVADLGCGPGRITGYLHGLGVSGMFGIDLSPEMVAVARRAHPGLRFEVGAMHDLDLADGSLGGVVAWYSTVHTPPEELPAVFAEFRRVLAPGGRLIHAFKVGDRRHRLEHGYGHAVDLDVYWFPVDRVIAMLTEAGLAVDAHLVREPDEDERPARGRGQQGYILAHRPGPA